MASPLYNPAAPRSFVCAYRHQIGLPAGETPAEKVEDAVLNIGDAWNRLIPSRKFRRMTNPKFDMIRRLLFLVPEAEIIAGIELYSKSPWHRKNAWMKFANYFAETLARDAHALTWGEDAMNAKDKVEAARPLPNALRDLTEGIGESVEDVNEGWTRRKQAFFALPEPERRHLIYDAEAILCQQRPTARLTKDDIQKYAIATMK